MTYYQKKYLKFGLKFVKVNGKYQYVFAQGLYTFQEVSDMIATESYIPVATAAELNALRNDVSQTMGAGSPWQGTYTTGLDKKYVQVDDLDLVGFANFNSFPNFSGIIDGNELNIYNLKIDAGSGPAALILDALTGTLMNMRIDAEIITTGAYAAVYATIPRPNGVIDNCISFGTVTGNGPYLGGIAGLSETVIKNCKNYAIISGGQYTGGIAGRVTTATDCENLGDTVTGGQYTGGITGQATTITGCINNSDVQGTEQGGGIAGLVTTATNCTNNGDVTMTTRWGGGISYQSTTITGCTNNGTITSFGNTVGGITGNHSAAAKISLCVNKGAVIQIGTMENAGGIAGFQNNANSIIENCYNKGSVASDNRRVGGIVGSMGNGTVINCYSSGLISGVSYTGGIIGLRTSGTITNTYYDTDTSGQSDTGKGLPRTTLQMQQGTADSFILPGGGIDEDSLAANAMYTDWSNDIWEFTPDNEYPKLK